MSISINMISKALTVKGQGVGSAYEEQVSLVKEMTDIYDCYENQRMKADITHFHTINFSFSLRKPFLTRKGISVGYVHLLPETVDQSINIPKFAKRAFYWYMIKFYKSMDYLVTVNPYFIDVLERYGVERDRVTYIPNFVSSQTFYRKPLKEKNAIREKYGIDKNKFVVLCAGQLQVRKGAFDFLEIAEKMPDVQFVWAGGFSFGSITDGYKDLVKAVDNPPANVKFLGIVDRSEMNDIYNMSDVMFLPSYEELFPMTILEAMCIGMPVLIRDLDIYVNILFDFYLRADTNEGFKDELDKLINDKAYYDNACALSSKGNAFYCKEHVSSMWRDYYVRIYGSSPKTKNKQEITNL